MSLTGFVGFNWTTKRLISLGLTGLSFSHVNYLIIKVVDKNKIGLNNLTVNVDGALYNTDDKGCVYIANRTFETAFISTIYEGVVFSKTYDSSIQTNQYIEIEVDPPIPTHRFLTTKPLKREYQEILPVDLLHFQRLDSEVTELKIKLTYTDNTSSTQITDISEYQLGVTYLTPIRLSTLKTINPGKTIKKIEVWVEEDPIITTLEYIIVSDKSDNSSVFYYKNSMGGLDYLVCEGNEQNIFEAEEVVHRKNLHVGYSYNEAEFEVNNQVSRDIYEVSTGNKPKKEILSLKDMIHHNVVHKIVVKDGVKIPVPVRLITKSSSLPSEWSNLKNLSFQYRYNYDNRAINRQ